MNGYLLSQKEIISLHQAVNYPDRKVLFVFLFADKKLNPTFFPCQSFILVTPFFSVNDNNDNNSFICFFFSNSILVCNLNCVKNKSNHNKNEWQVFKGVYFVLLLWANVTIVVRSVIEKEKQFSFTFPKANNKQSIQSNTDFFIGFSLLLPWFMDELSNHRSKTASVEEEEELTKVCHFLGEQR